MVDRARQHAVLIPHVRTADPIKARDWNHIGEHINRQNTGVNPIRPLSNAADLAGVAGFGRFRIKAVVGDYLNCVEWDGANEGHLDGSGVRVTPNVAVARPPLLRRTVTAHNSVTFVYTDDTTRTASASGEGDETQVIVPAYVVDDEIIAIKGIVRGTGAITAANQRIVWQDLNIDARAWAKQAE